MPFPFNDCYFFLQVFNNGHVFLGNFWTKNFIENPLGKYYPPGPTVSWGKGAEKWEKNQKETL
jgi:hypothetical protein